VKDRHSGAPAARRQFPTSRPAADALNSHVTTARLPKVRINNLGGFPVYQRLRGIAFADVYHRNPLAVAGYGVSCRGNL